MPTLYRSALALALSLPACRSAAPLAPARAAPRAPDLGFEIRAPCAGDPRVHLALRAHAAQDGSCELEQKGDWGGSADSSGDLGTLEAFGADGRALEVQVLGRGRWNLHAAPGEALRVEWSIAPNEILLSPTHQDHYRAALNGELFHAIGNHLWVAPVAASGAGALRITLDWKGFDVLGWRTVSSFGDAGHLELERPLDEFRQALFLAGRYRLLERSIRGRRLCVALPETGLRVDPEGFADLAARVVEGERAFFDDWDYPFYLVSAVATGREDARSSSLGGTGLTDSFALFLQRGSDLAPGAPLYDNVLHVLAHEMFHNWCGRWTPLAEPEELCYWFSEGFTEFFTRRLLLRTGLSTREEYARSLERSLQDYQKNPRRNCSNDEIRAGFWKERETGEMPYRRGDLLAARLDCAIRAASGGARSLDDFMREAVALGRRGEQLDVETLLARIARWTDAALAAELRKVVVDGATLELGRDTFAPCLAIENALVPRYELGFDFEKTRAEKVVRGVVPGSAAQKAGLCDGQKLAGFSSEQRADRPVRVDVLVDGVRRAIEYLPQGAGEELPCVQLAAEQGCEVL